LPMPSKRQRAPMTKVIPEFMTFSSCGFEV
jgi:hypothetical protein